MLQAKRDAVAFNDLSTIFHELLVRKNIRLGAARQYLERLADRASHAARPARSGSDVRVISSTSDSIANQVYRLLESSRPFKKLVAMSPFHSEDAGPLLRIAKRLDCNEVAVAVDGNTHETPMREGIKNVSFVQRKATGDRRPTHAKWFEFIGREPWLLTGSVNATKTSFETTKNFEIATLRRATPAILASWKPRKPAKYSVLPIEMELGSGHAAITATLDTAHSIKGSFLDDVPRHDGSWKASLVMEETERRLPVVQVVDGAFEIHLTKAIAIEQMDTCQLHLARGDTIATGWLMFEAELRMSREEREFTRRVRRLQGQSGDDEDFVGVLSWLADRVGYLVLGSAKPQSDRKAGEQSLPTPPGPFNYDEWVAGARFETSPHSGLLGACRTAFSALARFASRPVQKHGLTRLDEDEGKDFDPNEPTNGGEPDAGNTQKTPAHAHSLESLQHALERALDSPGISHEAAIFLLEALLWVLVVADRATRQVALDALPFGRWSAYAKRYSGDFSNDQHLALITLAAMSCAFALQTPEELRTEAFALLGRQAAVALQGSDLNTLVTAEIERSPSFSKLTTEQTAAAIKAVPELLAYEGYASQLRRFLDDWRASNTLTPPADLSMTTGGVIQELRSRRGNPVPFREWRDAIPERCPSPCYYVFDASDLAVLRNRRALKCIRCGMPHFWTGEN